MTKRTLTLSPEQVELIFGDGQYGDVWEEELYLSETPEGRRAVFDVTRDEGNIVLQLPAGGTVTLAWESDDEQDGETTAFNFSDESGEWYLKVNK